MSGSYKQLSTQNLDAQTINGVPIANGVPSINLVVPITLQQTADNGTTFTPFATANPVTLYINKTGRLVTITMQAFASTTNLTSVDSWLTTNYTIPAFLRPVTDQTAPNQYLGVMTYTYPLAPVDKIGAFGIEANNVLRLFGEKPAGGFNTNVPDTLSVYSTSMTYISAS